MMCRSISYLSSLLDKEDRSVRIAAGEALALMFEIGTLEKVSAEARVPGDSSTQGGAKPREGIIHIQGLRAKTVIQVRNLSVEAGGKGSAKKDLNNQRNVFKDVLEFLEVIFWVSVKIVSLFLHFSSLITYINELYDATL